MSLSKNRLFTRIWRRFDQSKLWEWTSIRELRKNLKRLKRFREKHWPKVEPHAAEAVIYAFIILFTYLCLRILIALGQVAGWLAHRFGNFDLFPRNFETEIERQFNKFIELGVYGALALFVINAFPIFLHIFAEVRQFMENLVTGFESRGRTDSEPARTAEWKGSFFKIRSIDEAVIVRGIEIAFLMVTTSIIHLFFSDYGRLAIVFAALPTTFFGWYIYTRIHENR